MKTSKRIKFVLIGLSFLVCLQFSACEATKEDQKGNILINNSDKELEIAEDGEPIVISVHASDIEKLQQIEMELDKSKAHHIVLRLCNDLANSWVELKRKDLSTYLIDNLDTHLLLRWIDYDIADRKQNTWKQLKSIDRVDLYDHSFEILSETQANYQGFAEIRYTRYAPTVTGINLDLTIGFEFVEEAWMITSFDMYGASIYREWKDSNFSTIEEMEEAFIRSCSERGILLN